MILHCTFEELSALSAGGERVLADAGAATSVVVAPPEVIADVEALLPQLVGDVSIHTLAEQQSVARAVTFIVAELKQRMDALILDMHPADEYAVQAYFDYAHSLSVQDRVIRLGKEMTAIFQVMFGHLPTAEDARTFSVPD
ncbi:MAG TPA: hypothetical protein VM100_01535 [Longimicrobiales bacterium]|nr:hypothetical protein [Longimicrobiales bacterium]